MIKLMQIVFAMMSAALASCGSQDILYPEEPTLPADGGSLNAGLLGAQLIEWYFPCALDDSVDAMETVEQTSKLYGHGPFKFGQATSGTIALGTKFDLCHPSRVARNRDLLLIIEASDIAAVVDPLINGTCNRFEVLKHQLAPMKVAGTTRLAIMTFADRVATVTTGFADTEAQLIVSSGANDHEQLAERVCNGFGRRSETGLYAKIEEMFRLYARKGASRTALLLSTEAPTASEDYWRMRDSTDLFGVQKAGKVEVPSELVDQKPDGTPLASVSSTWRISHYQALAAAPVMAKAIFTATGVDGVVLKAEERTFKNYSPENIHFAWPSFEFEMPRSGARLRSEVHYFDGTGDAMRIDRGEAQWQ